MKKFLNEVPEGASGVKKKFQKMLILAFEANSALSCENETKIVKITHSASLYSRYKIQSEAKHLHHGEAKLRWRWLLQSANHNLFGRSFGAHNIQFQEKA